MSNQLQFTKNSPTHYCTFWTLLMHKMLTFCRYHLQILGNGFPRVFCLLLLQFCLLYWGYSYCHYSYSHVYFARWKFYNNVCQSCRFRIPALCYYFLCFIVCAHHEYAIFAKAAVPAILGWWVRQGALSRFFQAPFTCVQGINKLKWNRIASSVRNTLKYVLHCKRIKQILSTNRVLKKIHFFFKFSWEQYNTHASHARWKRYRAVEGEIYETGMPHCMAVKLYP